MRMNAMPIAIHSLGPGGHVGRHWVHDEEVEGVDMLTLRGTRQYCQNVFRNVGLLVRSLGK